MPYAVRKTRTGTGQRPWEIYNTGNGHIAGHSATRTQAQISASIRNGTHRQAGQTNRGKMGRTQ